MWDTLETQDKKRLGKMMMEIIGFGEKSSNNEV